MAQPRPFLAPASCQGRWGLMWHVWIPVAPRFPSLPHHVLEGKGDTTPPHKLTLPRDVASPDMGHGAMAWVIPHSQSHVRTEREELAGVAEGPSFQPQEPRQSQQLKPAPTGPPAEPPCWPVETAPQTGPEPTCSQGKVNHRQPRASSCIVTPWQAGEASWRRRQQHLVGWGGVGRGEGKAAESHRSAAVPGPGRRAPELLSPALALQSAASRRRG